MKITPNNVMIDLETMGLVPGSPIVSIGAVVFDPRYNRVTKTTFYSELDWADQQNEGFVIDEKTLAWWDEQGEKAKEALCGLDDLKAELIRFAKWLPQDCKVWGNGPSFDIAMLEHCYRHFKLPIPCRFWEVYDCRTIKYMYESERGGFDRKSGGTKHNALDDAIFQAQYVCEMWRSLILRS